MKLKSITRVLFFAVAILTLLVNSTVAQNTSLSASPTAVLGGQSVAASWSNLEATGNDWISLHPADQSDSVYLNWQNAYGSSGSVAFSAPSQAGWYDFRLFRNGGKVATSNPFEVQTEIVPIPEVPTDNPPTPIDNADSSYYPAVSAPSIAPSGDCRWDLWFQLSGFAPNSEITVTSNYSAVNCVGEPSNSTWSGVMGTTDDSGNFPYGVVHQDTGTYTYTFSDVHGNFAVITFTTHQSATNPEIPLSSTPDISPGSTSSPGSSLTPIPSTPIPDCSQSPGVDLVIGESGYVNSSSGGNVNLRNAPTTTGAVVQAMVDDAEFIVTDGPICADGYWWWELDVAGQTGWAVGQLLAMGIVPEVVPTSTSTALPLYIQAQSGDGIHFGIYCRDKYQADEYREEGNARSWSCMKAGNRITLNLDDVCHDVWGDARPLINIPNESDIRGLTCQAQSGVPQNTPAQHSTNPKQCYAEQEDRTPGDTTVLRGTVFTFHWRVRCDDGENNGLPRAVKIEIDGVSYAEIPANEQNYTWNTTNVSLGTHPVCFMGASHGDEYWEKAARSCWTYQIVDQLPQQPIPTATNLPSQGNGNISTEAPVYGCPAPLRPRLTVGGQGHSTNQGQSLNIRASAGVTATKIGSLQSNQTFNVLAGPVCADAVNWWQINTDNLQGWIAEGVNQAYYVEPINIQNSPTPSEHFCLTLAEIRYVNEDRTALDHHWQLHVYSSYAKIEKGFTIYYRGENVTHNLGDLDLAGPSGIDYVDFWVSTRWALPHGMMDVTNRSSYLWSVVYPCSS